MLIKIIKRYIFKLVKVWAPFGITTFDKGDSGSKAYSLNISASSKDPDDDDMINSYYDKWEEFDRKMIQYGIKYSDIILGKKTESEEVVQMAYSRIVKVSDDGDYPRRLAPKIKEMYNDQREATGLPKIKVYQNIDGKYKEVEIESYDHLISMVPKKSYVKAILEPYAWFINKKYGISMSITQLLIEECNVTELTECAFTSNDGSKIEVKEEVKEVVETVEAVEAEEVVEENEAVEVVAEEEENEAEDSSSDEDSD